MWDDDDGWGDDWGSDASNDVRWNDDFDGDDGVFRWKGRVDIGADESLPGPLDLAAQCPPRPRLRSKHNP